MLTSKPITSHTCPYDKMPCNDLMCEEGPSSCAFLKLERRKTGYAISKVPLINTETIGE